jgi:predicted transcriptional regulator
MKEISIPEQFLQMASTKLVTKPMYIAAKLNIADHIAQGCTSATELALKTNTNEKALYRLLRALSSVGIFKELEGKRFELNALGECLLDRPDSPRGVLLWFNDPIHDRAWDNLLHSVKTGEPGFNKSFGKPVFEYFKENKEISETFNQAMVSNAKGIHALIAKTLDTKGIETLFDVGGGHGHLIRLILKENPKLNGGVYDIPHVVAGIKNPNFEVFGGDFFESIPSGAQAHIMSFIIHDWDDESCIKILRNCYKALPDGGKIFIAENIIGPPNEPSLGKLLDLEMLVMTTGKERTEGEFKSLLERAEFKFMGITNTEGPLSIVTGIK